MMSEPTKNQAPKYLRLPYVIFNVINPIVSVGTGNVQIEYNQTTMTKEEKEKLENHIKENIEKLKKDIVSYKQLTRPIAPDNAIGRLTRMEAITYYASAAAWRFAKRLSSQSGFISGIEESKSSVYS
jgi:hypothetical protein